MKIDDQWECWTLCAITNESTYRGGKGTTPVTTACPQDRWGWKPPTSWAGRKKVKWSTKQKKTPILKTWIWTRTGAMVYVRGRGLPRRQNETGTYYKRKEKNPSAVRSRISSKLIFAKLRGIVRSRVLLVIQFLCYLIKNVSPSWWGGQNPTQLSYRLQLRYAWPFRTYKRDLDLVCGNVVMKSPFSDPFDNLLFVGDDLPDNCVSSKPLRFFFF